MERCNTKIKRDVFPAIVPAQHQGYDSIIDLLLICTQANLKENK